MIVSTTDGHLIAEKDLELRGPGELRTDLPVDRCPLQRPAQQRLAHAVRRTHGDVAVAAGQPLPVLQPAQFLHR